MRKHPWKLRHSNSTGIKKERRKACGFDTEKSWLAVKPAEKKKDSAAEEKDFSIPKSHDCTD